jgi:hypothetical protein
MRNILAHGYFGVDLDILRAVLERDAPDIERQVEAILEGMQQALTGSRPAPGNRGLSVTVQSIPAQANSGRGSALGGWEQFEELRFSQCGLFGDCYGAHNKVQPPPFPRLSSHRRS